MTQRKSWYDLFHHWHVTSNPRGLRECPALPASPYLSYSCMPMYANIQTLDLTTNKHIRYFMDVMKELSLSGLEAPGIRGSWLPAGFKVEVTDMFVYYVSFWEHMYTLQ